MDIDNQMDDNRLEDGQPEDGQADDNQLNDDQMDEYRLEDDQAEELYLFMVKSYFEKRPSNTIDDFLADVNPQNKMNLDAKFSLEKINLRTRKTYIKTMSFIHDLMYIKMYKYMSDNDIKIDILGNYDISFLMKNISIITHLYRINPRRLIDMFNRINSINPLMGKSYTIHFVEPYTDEHHNISMYFSTVLREIIKQMNNEKYLGHKKTEIDNYFDLCLYKLIHTYQMYMFHMIVLQDKRVGLALYYLKVLKNERLIKLMPTRYNPSIKLKARKELIEMYDEYRASIQFLYINTIYEKKLRPGKIIDKFLKSRLFDKNLIIFIYKLGL